MHRQRIGKAAEAVLAGELVTLKVGLNEGGMMMSAQLLWIAPGRTKSVIACGGRATMEAMLPLAQAELERQIRDGVAAAAN